MIDFLFRQDVGHEAGLVRQLGPERFLNGGIGGKPAEIAAKLSQCPGVRRHANGLAPRLAGQPCENRSVETPALVLSCILPEKPIELPQHEFASCISIAQAPFEPEKALEFA